MWHIHAMNRPFSVASGCVGLLVLLMGFAAGCATSKIDWSAQVGVMTYDQAVLELGPPDKHAKLTDGTVVAEWLLRRGSNTGSAIYAVAPLGPAYYPGYYAPGPVIVTGPAPQPDRWLRLIFAPDGRLERFLKFSR
jgi:hypothetical protein